MPDPAATLDSLASRAGPLYSLPAVALEVLRLTANPTIDTRALKECIEKDPALTTRLLRVVNSSLFGLPREVSDLNQALALMGIKPLKLLVLGFSLPSALFTGLEGAVLGHYWRHTLTKAVAAREISQRIVHLPGDDAFLAGLLQDLGSLALVQQLGEPYERLLEQVHARGVTLKPVERKLFGFDHTQFTAQLLAQWGLPASLVEVVGWPDDDTPAGAALDRPALVEILDLAELLAQLLADGRTEVLQSLLAEGRERYGLRPDQLDELVADLEEKVRQLADVLSLELPEGMDDATLLARAYTLLTAAAEAAATDLMRRQSADWKADGEASDESLVEQFRQLSRLVEQADGQPAVRSAPTPAESLPCAREPASGQNRPAAAPKAPTCVKTSPVAERGAATGAHAPSCAIAAPVAPANRPAPSASAAVDDGPLLHALAAAVAACRQSRCALSLLLVALDRGETGRNSTPAEDVSRLRQYLELTCRDLDHPGAQCQGRGETGFALVLPDCGRRQAVELGHQLMEQFQAGLAWGRRSGGRPEATVSAGAATVSLPPRNFPPKDLVVAADRCLYGAQSSGGGGLKSIEIY